MATLTSFNSVCVCLTLRLSGWMVDLKVERLCVGSLNHSDVASCPLVCLGQRVGPPVRPVNLSTVHSDGEGMRQILMSPQNLDQPRTIILCRINGIRPAYSTLFCFFSMNVCVGLCASNNVKQTQGVLRECVACLCPFFLTWHRSRGCGALDNPQ